jgi:hypothetical protein
VFAHEFCTPSGSAITIVQNATGEVASSSPAVAVARTRRDINLSDQQEGIYDLKVGDEPPYRFIMLRDTRAPVAIIELPAMSSHFGANGAALSFAVTFKARRLQWVYHVCGTPSFNLSGTIIKGGGFSNGVEETISGRRTVTFTSHDAHPLGAGPFVLSSRAGNFARVVLPTAGPDAVKQADPKGAAVFAMYVYL